MSATALKFFFCLAMLKKSCFSFSVHFNMQRKIFFEISTFTLFTICFLFGLKMFSAVANSAKK
jgi:hypothetical protein